LQHDDDNNRSSRLVTMLASALLAACAAAAASLASAQLPNPATRVYLSDASLAAGARVATLPSSGRLNSAWVWRSIMGGACSGIRVCRRQLPDQTRITSSS
jgi:hypothetical protein